MRIRTIVLTAVTLLGFTEAHYANMGLDGVTCYIYNGIKGTDDGHMIVRLSNSTWYDHDEPSNSGSITVIKLQADYDALPVKTKIGIVCAPDDVDSTEIGVPYVEMEPSDADFYREDNTIYERSARELSRLDKRFQITCVIRFCKNTRT